MQKQEIFRTKTVNWLSSLTFVRLFVVCCSDLIHLVRVQRAFGSLYAMRRERAQLMQHTRRLQSCAHSAVARATATRQKRIQAQMAQSHGKCDSHMIDLLPQFYCFRTIDESRMSRSGRKHHNFLWTLVWIVKVSIWAIQIEFCRVFRPKYFQRSEILFGDSSFWCRFKQQFELKSNNWSVIQTDDQRRACWSVFEHILALRTQITNHSESFSSISYDYCELTPAFYFDRSSA